MPFPSNQCQQVQPEEIPNVSITQRVSPRGPLNPPPPRFSRDRIRRTRSPLFLFYLSFRFCLSFSSLPPSLLSVFPFPSSVSELEPTVNRNVERRSWNAFHVLFDLFTIILFFARGIYAFTRSKVEDDFQSYSYIRASRKAVFYETIRITVIRLNYDVLWA